MSARYAVCKIERATGRVVAVVGRAMGHQHACLLVCELNPYMQDGHYMTAVNENEERLTTHDEDDPRWGR